MYRIFDTETASLRGGVVDIAWLDIDDDLQVISTFRSFVNPQRHIEAGASDIHGIYDKDVCDAPTLAEVAKSWGDAAKVIGHNVAFDCRMIGKTLPTQGSMCTLALARLLLPEAANHKLQTLRELFDIPEDNAHSALGDVNVTLSVLKNLVDLSGVSLTTLWERAQQPRMLTKMPFGAHKGKAFTKVPKAYMNWLMQQPDLPKDLVYTLNKLIDV